MEDDKGLLVTTAMGAEPLLAPLSPGLLRNVSVDAVTEIAFDVAVPFRGPGVIALDGDRDHKLRDGESGTVTIRRDGPFVIDVEAAMRWAVAQGIMAPARFNPKQGAIDD